MIIILIIIIIIIFFKRLKSSIWCKDWNLTDPTTPVQRKLGITGNGGGIPHSPKAPRLEPHLQMPFRVIPRTLSRAAGSIFFNLSQRSGNIFVPLISRVTNCFFDHFCVIHCQNSLLLFLTVQTNIWFQVTRD